MGSSRGSTWGAVVWRWRAFFRSRVAQIRVKGSPAGLDANQYVINLLAINIQPGGRAPRQKCRSPSDSMLYRPPRAPSDTCRRPVVGSRATTCFLKRVPETVTSWRAASTEALGTVIVLVGPERTENALTRGRVPRRWARWFIAQVLTPFELCR